MKFCLEDGTLLVRESGSPDNPGVTLVLPESRAIKPSTTVAGPQPTLPYDAGRVQMNPAFAAPNLSAREPARRSSLPWLLGIAIVIGLSAIVVTLILTRSRAEVSERAATSTTSPQPSSEKAAQSNSNSTGQSMPATPEISVNSESQSEAAKEKPASPSVTRATTEQSAKESGENRSKPAFGPLMDNITFQGTNLTYYPRASPGMCQSDCARNANCKGFTWIKPGGYNPGDGAMCYLISAISGRVSHRCCMSAVKTE